MSKNSNNLNKTMNIPQNSILQKGKIPPRPPFTHDEPAIFSGKIPPRPPKGK